MFPNLCHRFLNTFYRLTNVSRQFRRPTGISPCLHYPAMYFKTDAGVGKQGQAGNHEIKLENLGHSRQKIEVCDLNGNGTLINWEKAGNGDHVVLLLPGLLGTIKTDFGPVFEKMDKSKYTLVSWDPPGYGLSRPPKRDFTGMFYQRDGKLVANLMETLGYEKFSILGWSAGGVTGACIAADFPSRVRRLVIWGAHGYADQQGVEFSKALGNLGAWSPKMLEPLVAIYGKEYLIQMMKDWHQGVTAFHQEGLNTALKNLVLKIKCPSLIIHGEEDPVLGVEHADFYGKTIPNSRVWIMPKAKHNLHLRNTDVFLKVVTKFLDAE